MDMLLKYAYQINIIAGLIVGMALQFIVTGKKGANAVILLILSTIFVAFYIVHPISHIIKEVDFIVPLVDYHVFFKTIPGSVFYSMAMAGSSLLSAELIGFIINVLPKKLKSIALKNLNIKDDSDDNE
jgi:hypothetical protein